MTKLKVDSDFEKGLSRKEDIEALKAGKHKKPERRLPKMVTDGFNLLISASIGGVCAWLAVNYFV